MIRVLGYRGVLLCGIFSDFRPDDEDFEMYKQARGLYVKNPWDRVKLIFSKDDHGDPHPEFKHGIDMFTIGLIVGALYGGTLNTSVQGDSYLHRNDLNIFGSRREALAAFVNHNTTSFVKGGLKSAPRFGIFFGGFSLISSCCEAYNNKPRITDSVIAGAVMGSLCKFSFGIKGLISGGVVGGVLGTIYGVIVWGTSKIMKTDQVQLKYLHFALKKYREETANKVFEEVPADCKYIEKSGTHSLHEHNPLNLLDDKAESIAEISDKTNKSE